MSTDPRGGDARSCLAESARLLQAGQATDALANLRDPLRRGRWDAQPVLRAGHVVAEALDAETGADPPLRVHVLAQCTATWLLPALTAVAWGRGAAVACTEGEYDNVLQGAMLLEHGDAAPEVLVLLPWHQRLLGPGDRSGAERVDDEVAFWQHVWEQAAQRNARIVQVGYDWTGVGAAGAFLAGDVERRVGLVRSVNQALRAALPAGAYLVDLPIVSGEMGRRVFYDQRNYFWTKQPFSQRGLVHLAEYCWAGVRAVTTGPKRVAVVDLDNTLWGGIVGETGPLDVALGESPVGEAFRSFQRYLRDLTARGCVLAVASKNNDADARGPFEQNPNMLLTLEHIAAFQANWDTKDVQIQRIAEELRLGLDSFVFVDDNPFERELVRGTLPEVEVVELPEDPADYVRAVEDGLWFESTGLTGEDAVRARAYVTERKRTEVQKAFTSLDEYLGSLEMVGDVRPISAEDMQRVVQLHAKTNQFNLTTRRHPAEAIQQALASPDTIGLTLRARDRFGDYGLIAVLLGVPCGTTKPKALRIDSWLMSCRVIGRTIEEFFFRTLVGEARAHGYICVHGEYRPTAKNGLVADLYPRLGFTALDTADDEATHYRLALDGYAPPPTFVTAGT